MFKSRDHVLDVGQIEESLAFDRRAIIGSLGTREPLRGMTACVDTCDTRSVCTIQQARCLGAGTRRRTDTPPALTVVSILSLRPLR